MKTFEKLSLDKTAKLKNPLAIKLLKMFEDVSAKYIYEKRNARRPNSNCIKYNLVKLGHELNYRVYANGLTPEQCDEQSQKYKFVCREFLYDIHWYKDIDGKFYTPETVALVAESELGDTRKGDLSKQRNPAIKFDFQKLLMANAELRLMIVKVYKSNHLAELNDYFEDAIREYKLLKKGSCFLFICFVHDTKELFYAEKYKA
jgi:hypothetical protein